VLTYYPKYHLDTVQIPPAEEINLDFAIREKWLSISIANHSASGNQFHWEYGDGTTSTKKNPKHYYEKAGKYTVTLFVQKDCRWYKQKRVVTVSDKIKYANHPQKTN
jgi:hypothetical protein